MDQLLKFRERLNSIDRIKDAKSVRSKEQAGEEAQLTNPAQPEDKEKAAARLRQVKG